MHFEDRSDVRWLAPHLVQLVDHAPGTEIRIDGVAKKWIRNAAGEWIEE